jgi:hypothetical protein
MTQALTGGPGRCVGLAVPRREAHSLLGLVCIVSSLPGASSSSGPSSLSLQAKLSFTSGVREPAAVHEEQEPWGSCL